MIFHFKIIFEYYKYLTLKKLKKLNKINSKYWRAKTTTKKEKKETLKKS